MTVVRMNDLGINAEFPDETGKQPHCVSAVVVLTKARRLARKYAANPAAFAHREAKWRGFEQLRPARRASIAYGIDV